MPKAKTRRLINKKINEGFGHPYARLHTQYTGYHSTTVNYSAARSYEDDRTNQFLTHFATVLKTWYSSLPSKSEIEIQIALVDDEYFFISSNKNKTVEDFFKEIVKEASFKEALEARAEKAQNAASKSKASDAFRNKRHSQKFISELDGSRDVDISPDTMFDASGDDLCVKIDVADDVGAKVAKFLRGAMGDKKVMLVTSGYEMHAEQKILLALCKAGRAVTPSTSVVFAGTFRPCRGCFESLSLVQTFFLPNLQFGSRPGHFWRTTTRAHVEIYKTLVAKGYISEKHNGRFDDEGRLRGLTETTNRPSLRLKDGATTNDLHYASDSDSDYEA